VDNESGHRFEPSNDRLIENILFFLWFVLLIPIVLFAIGAVAFGTDGSRGAYTLLASCWAYPVVLAIAVILRKKLRGAVYLPPLNAAAIIAIYAWDVAFTGRT
jgi:hypothetical protein